MLRAQRSTPKSRATTSKNSQKKAQKKAQKTTQKRNISKISKISKISNNLTTTTTLPSLSLHTQQKRKNYSFATISGPKDDRYLESGQVWVAPKAKIFDGTLTFSSIILERPPVCLGEVPQWEQDWYTYRHSKLTEKAWTLPKDLSKNILGKYHIDQEDFPEALPHITDEDLKNNRRSLYRALEDPLYLICKVQQDFDENLPSEIWMFPTTQVRDGETIRTSAERTLFYHAGDLEYYTLGNAPILYHPVRHSNMIKKEYPDAKNVKNFYMHSMYLGGNIELEPDGEITDYAWVKQDELHEYFNNDHCKDLLRMTGSSLYYLHAE
jgi:large subunit ribosomal protein L46